MTSTVTSLCNRALSEGGCRTLLVDINDTTPAGSVARLFYDPCRQQLLRAAQWGFARKTALLTELGSMFNTPPNSVYPWPFKYAYPDDCLKLRYILPQPPFPAPSSVQVPQVGAPVLLPFWGPSRKNRFVVSTDDSAGTDVKVVLANICNSYGVWTKDVTDVTLFDSMFEEALVQMLEYKFILPLSGNIKLKDSLKSSVEEAVKQARSADGNEAIPTTDVQVDWLMARGLPSRAQFDLGLVGDWSNMGLWYSGPDSLNWGA